MKYCTKCLLPDTKPYLIFDDNGICSACKAHEMKKNRDHGIDWTQKKEQFKALIDEIKTLNAPFYDVLVPVSGGKDSITQVHRLLGNNLRILAVNIDYGIKTEIGKYNLDLIPKMGAHLLIYRPEINLHKKLIKIGFEDFGDPDLLSHTLLHAYPLHIALQFKIPMVLLGENSAIEYSGEYSYDETDSISRDWFLKYAANKGITASDISKKYNIALKKLWMYDYPENFENSNIKAIFSSSYFFWDSESHLKIAKTYGFKTLKHCSEGTYRNYVGLDEKINRIHQYLKLLKLGYGRATDHACEDIRNGRISREAAKELIQKHDTLNLSDSYVDDFIQFINISRENFYNILELYRNLEIWKKDSFGNWFIPHHLEG